MTVCVACAACCAPNPDHARFCMKCGARLGGSRDVPSMKLVTVVFCDIAQSTELAQRFDPEVWYRILETYFATAGSALTGAGGRIEKFIGDAVVAVFGADASDENDAVRAVEAALDAVDRLSVSDYADLQHQGARLSIRCGIASGRVMITDRDSSFAIGSVMNRAARLQGAAAADSVVLDGKTWLLVRERVVCEPLVAVAAKGFDRPLRVWRAIRGARDAERNKSMINQVALLSNLHSQVRCAMSVPGVTSIGLVGPIGSGKTRILDELARGLDGSAVTLLRIAVGGSDADPGVPRLHEVYRQIAGRSEDDHLGDLSVRELQWTIRRRLAQLATRQPLVVIIDDYPQAPAVVRELFDLAPGTVGPLVLIAAGRDLAGFTGQVLEVPMLAPDDARELLRELVSDIELHATTTVEDQLIERSGGNPLFLQQLAAMAAEGMDDELPPSAEAALGARISRISPHARHILACLGAWDCAGRTEDLASVCNLDEPAFAAGLDELEAAGLDSGRTAGEVAYAHTVLSERAEIHGAIARNLVGRSADLLLADLAAVHALRSQEYWHELEPGGTHDEVATELAVKCLVTASRAAIFRSDFRAAADICRQARELGCGEGVTQLEIAVLESYALGASGLVPEAMARIADAESLAGNPAAIAHLKVNKTVFTGVLDPATVTVVDGSPDVSARARLDLWRGAMRAREGNYPGAEQLLRASYLQVRNLSSCLGMTDICANLALVLAYGDAPPPAALRQCLELRAEVADSPLLHAKVSCAAALLTAVDGDVAAASQMLAAARSVCGDIGHRRGEGDTWEFAGEVAELAGDYTAARDAMMRARQIYLDAGAEAAAALCAARAYVLEPEGEPPDLAALDLVGSWVARMLAHQVAAISTAGTKDSAAHLGSAVEEVRKVCGAGATTAALRSCLRTARLIGDASLTKQISALLAVASEQYWAGG